MPSWLGGVSRHRSRPVPCRGTGHPAKLLLARHGNRRGHPRVFEGAGGIHSLMLGGEAPQARTLGAAWQFKYWRIPLAESDDIAPVLHGWQQVAETPHAALVQSVKRLATLEPKRAQLSSSLGIARLPGGIEHFQ